MVDQNNNSEKKLFSLIHNLYNSSHGILDSDTNKQLIKSASEIEKGKELNRIAFDLYPYLLSEMNNKKKNKPIELNDLMQFVLQLQGKYGRFSNMNRVGLFF